MPSATSALRGISSAHPHTIEHYDTAFYRPMTAETGTWDQWVEEGRRDVEARAAAGRGLAHRVLRNHLLSTKGLPKGSDEYVARRGRELPDEAF